MPRPALVGSVFFRCHHISSFSNRCHPRRILPPPTGDGTWTGERERSKTVDLGGYISPFLQKGISSFLYGYHK